MAAIKPAVLEPGAQLGTSAAALYTCPANTTVVIGNATFTNVGAAQETFTIYIVRSGGSAGPTNTLIDAESLAVGETYVSAELKTKVLNAGDSIQAQASAAASINAFIDGYTM
jgi:hypothetical protein